MTFAYVATIGATPTHSATTLQAAQSAALTAETRYSTADQYEHRWDEHRPGQTWRLMQRRKDRKGRYAWTQRAVHAVEHITT
ncbi:hypothetical protein [Streptomyces sp. NPDC058872]|uniref:hypothetical protein n=1 Tax=Streptomyces sp. NPDC058872 TaxID=3346661 RepID=UPI0036B7FCB1